MKVGDVLTDERIIRRSRIVLEIRVSECTSYLAFGQRAFSDADLGDSTHFLKNDDYVQLSISRHF